ncbi:DUF3152 domain-containing protein [Streptomyces rectiverticillatus]|uniref:DUF3152 domain-containing protein n=1 Tax=Streptomyces rectiverticillatus TaxID=173860 RepID=UPI001FE67696|nr:DUF3152 domain-containing protein [Streptomyces rectiverticillatus]
MGKHSARAPRAVSRPAVPAAPGAGGGQGAAGHEHAAVPGEGEGDPLYEPVRPAGPVGRAGPEGFPGQRQEVGVGWGVIGVQRAPATDAGVYGPGSVPGYDTRLAGYLGGYGTGQDAAACDASFDAPYDAPYDSSSYASSYESYEAGHGAGHDAAYDTSASDTFTAYDRAYDTAYGRDAAGPAATTDAAGHAAYVDQAYSAYWLGGAPAPSTPAPGGGPVDGPGGVLTDVHARVPAPAAGSDSVSRSTRVPAPRPATARPRTGGSRGVPPAKTGGAVARTATGVAAAVVTAVLAVVVAGQVEDGTETQAQARPADVERQSPDAASRSDSRPTPNGGVAAPVTYEQKMDRKYPLDAKAKGSGSFDTVGGHDRAPGRGEVVRYRVDVEKGLPLDGELFATAVHRTLNDERSWGHGGTRTFERVSSGDADWVITLASPGTTAAWCAKSGLDTTQDNVSCDSAATDRVMINAYRWAQGAATYGDKMHAYRQMLINHEVGHRLGRDHEACSKEGALAPVMMQQTKFLTSDGVTCKPNAWPYP